MTLSIKSTMRIAYYMRDCGIASRRQSEILIKEGKVYKNGIQATINSSVVVNSDEITINSIKNPPITIQDKLRIWLYNKPTGIITTHQDPQGRETVFEVAKSKNLPYVCSIGRLDINSEGLLLLTNKASFSHFAETNGWERKYKVRYFGNDITANQRNQLNEGIIIGNIQYGKIFVDNNTTTTTNNNNTIKNNWLTMTLTEGKNREIRKILEYFGNKVNRLIRVSYGPFHLGSIPPGEIIEVNEEIVDKYRNIK